MVIYDDCLVHIVQATLEAPWEQLWFSQSLSSRSVTRKQFDWHKDGLKWWQLAITRWKCWELVGVLLSCLYTTMCYIGSF